MRRRLLQQWRKRRNSGSVAIEFALIAPVFFLLLFGILETTLALFASMILENGMKQTARLIRTGQAQTSSMTQDQFRTALCDQVNLVLSCDASRLYIDIRSFT